MFDPELKGLDKYVDTLAAGLTKLNVRTRELSSSGGRESLKESLEGLVIYTSLDDFRAKLEKENIDTYFRAEKVLDGSLVLKFLICLTSVLDHDIALDWMLAALLDFNIHDPEVVLLAPKVLKYIIEALKKRQYTNGKSKSKGHTITHIVRSLLTA